MKRHLATTYLPATTPAPPPPTGELESPGNGKNGDKSARTPFSPGIPSYEIETDPTTLTRRQKQIDYGKNTEGYLNYLTAVPRKERQPFHPKTPNLNRKYSRRAWDGLVRQWRLDLHCWSQAGSEARPHDKMDLGASAADYEPCSNENESSFTSAEECESAAETGSTSSSISAAFGVVGMGGIGNTVRVGQDLDATLTPEPSLQLQNQHQSQSHHGKRSKLSDVNLNESPANPSPINKNCSWAQEVEEEYYSGSSEAEDGVSVSINIKPEVK